MSHLLPPVSLSDAKTGDRVIIQTELEREENPIVYWIKEVQGSTKKNLKVNGKLFFRDGVACLSLNQRLLDPTPEVLAEIEAQNQRVLQRKEARKQTSQQVAQEKAQCAQNVAHVLLAMDPPTIVSFLSQENLLDIYQNNTVIRNCVQPLASQTPDGDSDEQAIAGNNTGDDPDHGRATKPAEPGTENVPNDAQ